MTRQLALVALCLQLLATPIADADEATVGAGPNSFDAWANKASQAPVNPAKSNTASNAATRRSPRVRYEWRNPCGMGFNNNQAMCPQNNCPPGQQIYRLWQVAPPPPTPLRLVCSGDGPPAVTATAAPPQVTAGMVLNAFRRIPLPSLRSHSQPANKTLINFDTIFFTNAQALTRTVTLLGQSVRLEIRPSRFEWVHGDGTTETTATPGAPYPNKEIVYRYADAHRTVAHRVVVTWSAEYSLNGGPLQPVNGTVTTTGPSTPLRIAEASPALSGSGH